MPGRYIIEALERGMLVLSQFDQNHPTLTMTDLIRRTGINKTTMFRILSTLEETGYLERDPVSRSYRPGIRVFALGFTALSSMDIRQLARPSLEALAQKAQLTASLSILDGVDIVYVDRIRKQQVVGVVLGLGSRLPAHCVSMGKAMLAHLRGEDLERYLQTAVMQACTPNTITDPDLLREELGRVREAGVAYNVDELAIGLRAVAAPILDSSGQPVAALNVSGSSNTISEEYLRAHLAPLVRDAAHQISRFVTM
jgi:IclR family pca regulon transcriptional regulator